MFASCQLRIFLVDAHITRDDDSLSDIGFLVSSEASDASQRRGLVRDDIDLCGREETIICLPDG